MQAAYLAAEDLGVVLARSVGMEEEQQGQQQQQGAEEGEAQVCDLCQLALCTPQPHRALPAIMRVGESVGGMEALEAQLASAEASAAAEAAAAAEAEAGSALVEEDVGEGAPAPASAAALGLQDARVWPSGTLLYALLEFALGHTMPGRVDDALQGEPAASAPVPSKPVAPLQQEAQHGQQGAIQHPVYALHSVAIPIVYGSSWSYCGGEE